MGKLRALDKETWEELCRQKGDGSLAALSRRIGIPVGTLSDGIRRKKILFETRSRIRAALGLPPKRADKRKKIPVHESTHWQLSELMREWELTSFDETIVALLSGIKYRKLFAPRYCDECGHPMQDKGFYNGGWYCEVCELRSRVKELEKCQS